MFFYIQSGCNSWSWSLIVSLYVIVNDVIMLFLTRLHYLQNFCKAPVQRGQMCFWEERGHSWQRILSQRFPHDVAQSEIRKRQQTQAEEGGATDPVEISRVRGSRRFWKRKKNWERNIFKLKHVILKSFNHMHHIVSTFGRLLIIY